MSVAVYAEQRLALVKSFHEKAGECQVCFSFFPSCEDVFVLLPPCEFLPLSQAAPLATLPSAL